MKTVHTVRVRRRRDQPRPVTATAASAFQQCPDTGSQMLYRAQDTAPSCAESPQHAQDVFLGQLV